MLWSSHTYCSAWFSTRLLILLRLAVTPCSHVMLPLHHCFTPCQWLPLLAIHSYPAVTCNGQSAWQIMHQRVTDWLARRHSDSLLQDVRDDALHLLDVLSSRIWKDTLRDSKATAAVGAAANGGQSDEERQPRVAVVIGNLQDSYQQFQYQLSAKLARCISSCQCQHRWQNKYAAT